MSMTALLQTLIWIFLFQFDESDAFERSGNPGYVVGQPILAGKLQQYEDPDGNIKYPFPNDITND